MPCACCPKFGAAVVPTIWHLEPAVPQQFDKVAQVIIGMLVAGMLWHAQQCLPACLGTSALHREFHCAREYPINGHWHRVNGQRLV